MLGIGSRDILGAALSRAEPQPGDATLLTFDATSADSELLLNADVEADADDDGYGDITRTCARRTRVRSRATPR
jgi:hypothetical protein